MSRQRRPITLDPNSTYHSIMVKKMGRAGAIATLQRHEDMQHLMDTATHRATKAYAAISKPIPWA